MTMPVQKPHRSKQDYGTPWELIRAVERRWGKIVVDLAASPENAKCPAFYTKADNALERAWHKHAGFSAWIPQSMFLHWLNPPFENIGAWAAKCKTESALGARIIMLTPASVGAEWFAQSVDGVARAVVLRPRVTYEGCKDPFPKDCMLTLWGIEPPGFETWRYK